MSIDLTQEQTAFAQAVASFCAKEAGTRAQRDALTEHGKHTHNQALYDKMAELGWLGAIISEEHGGAGGSTVDLCILLEESAKAMAPIGGIGPTLITGAAYEKFGTPAQKETVLGGIVAGRSYSISMSEPEAGSDVGNLSCRAEKTDTGWLINGQKTWCSNAHFADRILLVARTGRSGAGGATQGGREGGKHEGLTMFDVPADVEGLNIVGIDTMGGKEVNDLYFTDCALPGDAVVGVEGQGWSQLMTGLNIERLILAAMMLGTAQRAFDDTLDFITQRKQFGRPVGTFQALRHRIADLATEIECGRLLVYHVARLVDESPTKLFPREASMAKLKLTETAKKVALEGMQMMGGYGYATEFDMEKHVRTTLVSSIYGGTNEIQRDIIGKTYGL
ncbi:acyl-CoA/acyl-ACP dehydrogenase [Rhodococcus sp. IEGM 1401]|uniref:acyl-CoA dehydrogenase family protein n=1 Tax=unclassified Rhodococcus (in: high G+C Gram-positive bacteria) TaxID=192944 RepID=UPI0022B4C138|nr:MULTISPECIES: acyl-CoA dehydrogenase family protein [unclassified Rhodococcus (in: high G+C Gram-positive bacteria)]MCZ4562309.1 acyl-CoA/acyl-ACP dehydrogenase [Rhodococcus sp. IEGM 1401]MDI9922352.1 acyl-CoA dehydrogenase family protein [Rhodococcus sp. IEGM 1372]MDI9926708.1 acyl-CoA dehydrogenase family protein [Rhodococcus sp. IEGM 1341]MDV8034903.1 acyl-CoA dehydrogenase family protein [Rhodococcus sp. IEGM 1414]